MWPEAPRTEELLDKVRKGEPEAVDGLLAAHREPLRRMIGLRLDPALAARLDASDVVQDVLLEAHRRLSDYLRNPTMPFHLWLRHIAKDHLIDAHRRHRVGPAPQPRPRAAAGAGPVQRRILVRPGRPAARPGADARLGGRAARAAAPPGNGRRRPARRRPRSHPAAARRAAVQPGNGRRAGRQRGRRVDALPAGGSPACGPPCCPAEGRRRERRASVPSDADRDQRLADLLADLSEQARQGRDPDLDGVAARHPDLCRELRELWAAVQIADVLTLRDVPTARSARNVPSLRPRPPTPAADRRRARSATTNSWRRSAAAAWASSTRPGSAACSAPSPSR